MTPQNTTAYIEITLEQTAAEAHVPATLYYHEEKKVFLKVVDLSMMLEDCWNAAVNRTEIGDWTQIEEDSPPPDKAAYINSILNPK